MKTITKKQIREITSFKSRREKLQLNLREVEEATGISNPLIHQIENFTTKNPSFYTVVKLHNYYRSLEIKKAKVNGKDKKATKNKTRRS